MVVADLHIHTTRSDGSLSFSALPRAARAANLTAVAVTDHDRLNPALEQPIVERAGLTIIHGIELRVRAGSQRLDLLGYGATRTDALVAELERLQADRIERAKRMVECLEDRLDVTLDVAYEPGVGRPHIAAAVTDSLANLSTSEVFEDFIGDGEPCYVSRAIPDFERGRRLLEEACELVGLAHPLRYDDPEGALQRTASLDAIERWYPYTESVDHRPVDAAIRDYDLVPTGGSDAHGTSLGITGLDAAAYRTVTDALGIV